MKNAFILFFAGLVILATLLMLFGKVDPERFCNEESSAVVYFPNIIEAMNKAVGSETFRVVFKEGSGEERSGQLFKAFDELNSGAFTGSLMKLFMPRIMLVFGNEVPSIGEGQTPFLTVVDIGRPGLIVHFLGLSGKAGKGAYSGDYLGHPIFMEKDTAMTMIRNIILVGPEKLLKLAVDAYENKAGSLAVMSDYKRGLEDFIEKKSDAQIIFINSAIFIPQGAGSLIDPGNFLNTGEFGVGAARLNIKDEGLRISAKFLSKSGKPLVKLLDTGAHEFKNTRFIDLDSQFVTGIRVSNPGDASRMAASAMLADDSSGGGLKQKLLQTILNQFLAHLGPEFLFFPDNNNDLCFVTQIREESKFRTAVEKVSTKFGDGEATLSEIIKNEDALKEALQFGQLTLQEIKEYIETLPDEVKEKARALVNGLPLESLKSVVPKYKHINLKGKTLYYHIASDLLFISTSAGGIDHLVKLADAPEAPSPPFDGGAPTGSAFFAMDITDNFRAVLPNSAGKPEFERLFEIPWLATAQLFDEGTSILLDVKADVPLGPFLFEQDSTSFYEVLLRALHFLLLAPGIFALYIFIRRLHKTFRASS